MRLIDQIRAGRGPGNATAVLGLGIVALWLVLAAIVGAIAVEDDPTTVETDELAGGTTPDSGEADPSQAPVTEGAPPPPTDPGAPPPSADPNVAPAPGAVPTDPAAPGAAPTGRPGTPAPGPAPGQQPAPNQPGQPAPAPDAPAVSSSGGDTTGVTNSSIKIGVHAPRTFSGVPLDLARDPIKGLETYVRFLNENGGINGRKMDLRLEDDRYDSDGGQRSAQRLINDEKVFAVSGTLGIDQIAIVGAEAAKRNVPYVAGGGSETNRIPGMYQILASYDTHALKLAEYMATDPNLRGKRVGMIVLDSEYVRPVADVFKRALEQRGMTVSAVVHNQKPQQNPDYNGYILEFRRSNTEVVVPLTDPLTTQQIVQRCAAGAACGWTYTFSNFAHDSDTALALMAPTWAQQRVRGLSGACYFRAPEVDGPNCGQMRVAREQYIAVHGQEAWEDEGSGAAFGYQIVGFLKGALSAPGADLTRERFRGAIAAYNGYSDLVTGPITFAGSSNTMHGAEKMTVFEAQSDNTWKMITPGFVDGF